MAIPPTGRSTSLNPGNRFEALHIGPAPDDIAGYFEPPDADRREPTIFFRDRSLSILSKNDSPDLGFAYSMNPYRGCEHGCVYCYARPSHEYLGFSSGLDFETKILVKYDAPDLLAQAFDKTSWQPQVVALSGNTDCYQPVERTLGITRKCLEVFLRYRNPVGIITKNALIQRDIDILSRLSELNLVFVSVSITTIRQELARSMEPRTASVRNRFETIHRLHEAGVPVGVNIAPIIPGLNDEEIPALLTEAARCGASRASHTMIRLPYAVKDLFIEWLQRTLPDRSGKIVARIRSIRGGGLSSSEYGKRMTGEGEIAEAISRLFRMTCTRLGLNTSRVALATTHFRRPGPEQLRFL